MRLRWRRIVRVRVRTRVRTGEESRRRVQRRLPVVRIVEGVIKPSRHGDDVTLTLSTHDNLRRRLRRIMPPSSRPRGHYGLPAYGRTRPNCRRTRPSGCTRRSSRGRASHAIGRAARTSPTARLRGGSSARCFKNEKRRKDAYDQPTHKMCSEAAIISLRCDSVNPDLW